MDSDLTHFVGQTQIEARDSLDQLTAHTDQAGLTSTFTYDAQGRIKRAASGPFARTYNYALADSPVGISSAHADSAAGQPAQQARSQERSYGPLGLIEQRTNDQAPVYPIADALGNTLGELGEDGKAELLPETDPWGEVVVREAGANPESPIDAPTSGFLGAAGRIELPAGGLTKLGARYYDSGIGAFISVDPVTGGPEEPIRRAGYLYGAGNPARFVDVDGESFGDAIAGAYNHVTAPIKSKAEAISMELGRISSDPSSSGLERFSANFYGGLSSLASCESFDEAMMSVLPGPRKFKGLGKAGEVGVGAVKGKGVGRAILGPAGVTSVRVLGPLSREQQIAVDSVMHDPAKIQHIFGNMRHNLDPLVSAFGSRGAVIAAAVRMVPRSVSGVFEVSGSVGGHVLVVRGRSVNGVPRIGTVFAR